MLQYIFDAVPTKNNLLNKNIPNLKFSVCDRYAGGEGKPVNTHSFRNNPSFDDDDDVAFTL